MKLRDSEGDVWDEDARGWYVCRNGGGWLPLDVLERLWGPVSEVADE
jgi:hypothetical protein